MLRLKMAYIVALVTLMSIPNLGTAEPVAPNEVCVYQHIHYANKLGCFSLKPGMRHVLVPHLGKSFAQASSIQMGNNVQAMCFDYVNFEDKLIYYEKETHLRCQKSHPGHPNIKFRSLIVTPRGQGVKGVRLFKTGGGNNFKYLPLPEYLKDSEARFELTGSWNDKVYDVEFFGDVEVVLFRDHHFKGEHVTLPGSGYYDAPPGTPKTTSWDLENFGLEDELSSVILRDVHPLKPIQTPIKKFLPPPEREGEGPDQVHRAPPAHEPTTTPALYTGPVGAVLPTPSIKPSLQLANLITGNTLKVSVGTQGVSWSIYFRPDSTVFARSNQGKEDSGKWWINGQVYCTQYQHLNNSKRSCYSLTRVDDQLRLHKAENGQQVGVAEIMQGDPEQLGQ